MIPNGKCLYNDFFSLSWLSKTILGPCDHPVTLQSKVVDQQVHFAEEVKLSYGVGVEVGLTLPSLQIHK